MHRSLLKWLLLAGCLPFISGCYYDNESLLYPGSNSINCNGVNAKFSADVKPILQAKCTLSGCHNAASGAGGTILETYSQVAAKASRINARCVVQKNMPPSAPLTSAETATLKCWIDSGTPNN
jgi:uncharacterized membrane protein